MIDGIGKIKAKKYLSDTLHTSKLERLHKSIVDYAYILMNTI